MALSEREKLAISQGFTTNNWAGTAIRKEPVRRCTADGAVLPGPEPRKKPPIWVTPMAPRTGRGAWITSSKVVTQEQARACRDMLRRIDARRAGAFVHGSPRGGVSADPVLAELGF